MKNLFNYSYTLILAVLLFSLAGCDKTKEYEVVYPEAQAHFTGNSVQNYQILSATEPAYKVTVGTTDVTSADRTITYKVTTPTGATGGTHYTIATGNTTGTVTIPAGKSTADILVQGIYAPYNGTGRRDTLVFTLAEPSVKAAAFQSSVKLALRGPCFEGDVTLTNFTGAWKAIEQFGTGAPYGPYNVTIPTVVSTGPTSGTITVTNIWDNGWGPIQFNLDWSNPASRTVLAIPQAAIPGSNAGDLSATYAGQTIAERPFPTPVFTGTGVNVGTFSACNNTITLRMQLGVTGVGYFANIYTVNLTRP
jgi:hypothetical protein